MVARTPPNSSDSSTVAADTLPVADEQSLEFSDEALSVPFARREYRREDGAEGLDGRRGREVTVSSASMWGDAFEEKLDPRAQNVMERSGRLDELWRAVTK